MIVDIFNTNKKWQIIYADPPWKQRRGNGEKRKNRLAGTELDYQTLSLEEIEEHLRKATEHTTENSIMFLWAIDKYLFQAQEIAERVGYKLHARMIWDKMNGIPAAYTVRFGHEYLLYMYRGKFTPIAENERGKIHTVFREKAKRHSQKPEIAYEIIERLYPNAERLEMYARNERNGWDCWGNEVTNG